MHAVDHLIEGSGQFESFAVVRQLARPAAYHIRHTWLVALNSGQICRHQEIAATSNRDVRKRKVEPASEMPAGQVDQVGRDVVQLQPFVADASVHRVKHNLVYDELAREGSVRIQYVSPLAACERIR